MSHTAKIIILSLLSAGLIFGVFAMTHKNADDHMDCVTAKIEGTSCAVGGNPIQIAGSHIDALKQLGLATLQSSLVTSTAAFALLLFAVLMAVPKGSLFAVTPSGLRMRRADAHTSLRAIRKQQHWITLHERGASPRARWL